MANTLIASIRTGVYKLHGCAKYCAISAFLLRFGMVPSVNGLIDSGYIFIMSRSVQQMSSR